MPSGFTSFTNRVWCPNELGSTNPYTSVPKFFLTFDIPCSFPLVFSKQIPKLMSSHSKISLYLIFL